MIIYLMLCLAPAPSPTVKVELRIQDDINYGVEAEIDTATMEVRRGDKIWKLDGPPKFKAILQAAGEEQRRSGHFNVTVFAVADGGSRDTLLLRWAIVRDD